MAKYALGIDYGTESGRALLVDVATGQEVATAVCPYPDGVIDRELPGSGVALGPDWALQNPADYLLVLERTIPQALRGIAPTDVIGLGIDFTACTMLPVTRDGTPLCQLSAFRDNPHAWVKLWKHHAAQPQADRINTLAREREEPWLARYGGKISSEWFFAKALQILKEAPEVYRAANRLIEAADWVVWQLTGSERRNSCTAGYKAMWDKRAGFPSNDFFKALHPDFEHIVDEKMSRHISPLGQKAGGLTKDMAQRAGLEPGTAVAVANVDAHVSVPAATVTEPGKLVMVMGTSICHMVLGRESKIVEGMCGVVEDGILPGYYGFEAGQSCVGDLFAWFARHAVPPEYHQTARRRKTDVHHYLEQQAARLRPGESGLLALDWWNGNRSILVDADLSGLLVGCTLATRPEEIYRALIEATAFGTNIIIEAFQTSGVEIQELYACGGLPERNQLLMQIYADVTNRDIKLSASPQTPALGAAMFGAVAAGGASGGYDTIQEAARHMAKLRDTVYRPDPAAHQVYRRLFQHYRRLHDDFGRGGNDVMKDLKRLRAQVRQETLC